LKRALLVVPLFLLAGTLAFWSLAAPQAEANDVVSPLARLREGNERFAAGELARAHQTLERRSEVARGQHPLAVIVGCADSRVPPELVFDQGLGDLFVVRCAGNVLGDAALGSIEYAVEHLGCELVVVLGHERCGAVEAVLKGGALPGHLAAFVPAIQPSATAAKKLGGDALDQAVRLNALRIATELRVSEPLLAEHVHGGSLTVVAARYDLDTGEIEWLDAPEEAERTVAVETETAAR
jgi:carbonic anhydrase